VHKWVGDEPSGGLSNAPIFDSSNKPHNPLVDSGSLVICALLTMQKINI
jgi:glutaminase